MRYSIEETTLTNIGDALRRRHGETKKSTVTEEREIPELVISKSVNATGRDSWNGLLPYGEFCNTITIPNAKSIKVNLYYGTYAAYQHVYVVSGEHNNYLYFYENSTDYYTAKPADVSFAELNFDNTDTISFLIRNGDDTEEKSDQLGYYAECYGYDEDGNLLNGRTVEVEKEVEVPNTYSSAEMANAIDTIKGGYDIPEKAFTLTGNCMYIFHAGSWDWFLEEYGDKITTQDITSAGYMFSYSKVEGALPFEINFADGGSDCSSMFYGANFESIPSIDFKHTNNHKGASSVFYGSKKLKEIGTLKNLYPNDMGDLFKDCEQLRYLPVFENVNWERMHTYNYSGFDGMFAGCLSLREIPEDFLKECYGIHTSVSSTIFYGTFNKCTSLNEIRGLNPQTGTLSSNAFSNTFVSCYRLKDLIFKTQEDGTPYAVTWKNQTIDLTKYVGRCNGAPNEILNYNSGITADKQVTDDVSYQALKNDPDWFTSNPVYSRYNKTSAVNTINSLPDTSTGSGNVIKFAATAGSATDGGAINTLSESEIAVAAAKGWTVTLV